MSHSEEKEIKKDHISDDKDGGNSSSLCKAESKTQSLLPPKPGSEEKKHWSTTENGALVARATAHVYRAIVASQTQGGMKDFLEEKCALFKDLSGDQSLECTLIFQEYEKNIDAALDEFAATEGKTCLEVMRAAEIISSEHKMADKNLQMLLAATGYDKFSKMMHRKALEQEAKKNTSQNEAAARRRKVVTSNDRHQPVHLSTRSDDRNSCNIECKSSNQEEDAEQHLRRDEK